MSSRRARLGRAPPFQFNLRDLFKLVLLLSLYLGLIRATGEFLATLGSGVFIVVGVLAVFRVEETVRGALLGTYCSVAILILATMAFPPASGWTVAVSWLFYPPLGYTVGVLYSADRDLRRG